MTRISDVVARVRAYGTDAVAFQSLESHLTWWTDEAPPHGTGAALAYVDAGGSWIAVGTPLAPPAVRVQAAQRFAAAARAARRRAVFFGVEDVAPFAGFRRVPIGLQGVLLPSRWRSTLRASRKLREQLRRGRAKGVTVRRVAASELVPGARLRQEVERLAAQWLETRHMEPLAFLVAVELFHEPEAHLYAAAEWKGRVVQFVSAVPIAARRGWLVEDILRAPDAPNGTSELLVDLIMRQLVEDDTTHDETWVTHGLTPLAGAMPWWLRLARAATSPLYDFSGLWRFRSRLSQARWDQVWIVWDRGPVALVFLDVLRAFSDRHLVRFAWRSLVRHPNGPPSAVAVPLVPWTILLSMMATTGRAGWLGFSTAVLAGWIVFDALLAWQLFRAAYRPRRRRLFALTVAAAIDAAYSLYHLATVGLGASPLTVALRLLATVGPLVGTAGLAWATHRAEAVTPRARPGVSS